MIDIAARLHADATAVDTAMARWLPPEAGLAARLMTAMRYAALGPGKRLRPFLLLEAGRVLGATPHTCLRAAVALECVHAYSLVHDDLPCMDDDDLRRGRPTTHRAFDEATAVLAGDGLLTFAFELLADPATHADAAIRADLVLALARAAGAHGMVGGQMIDMAPHAATLDVITAMQAQKTGALITHAISAAGIIAGAAPAVHEQLRHYGDALGLMFQMVDDLLDAEGDSTIIGKTAGKDAAQGKVNFVTLLGVDATRTRVGALLDDALRALEGFDARADGLRATARFMARRQS